MTGERQMVNTLRELVSLRAWAELATIAAVLVVVGIIAS